jgi:hypothetical protein
MAQRAIRRSGRSISQIVEQGLREYARTGAIAPAPRTEPSE